jgi:hypothetical protein
MKERKYQQHQTKRKQIFMSMRSKEEKEHRKRNQRHENIKER